MAKFKPLVDSSVKDAEAEVSKYWKDINILEKTLEKGENDPSYVFYEGPPTANGNPGIHHVVARTLKIQSNERLQSIKKSWLGYSWFTS